MIRALRLLLPLGALFLAASSLAQTATGLPPGVKLPPGLTLPPGFSLPAAPSGAPTTAAPLATPVAAPAPPAAEPAPAPAVTPQPPPEAPSAGATKKDAPPEHEARPAETVQAAGPELSPIEKALSADRLTVEQAKAQPSAPEVLTQFGYGFFKPSATGFPPVLDVPVAPDYPVGPGDRITLTLWGSVEGVYDLEVSRTGEVTLPKVGTVKVWGVPLGRLAEVLRGQLARVYKEFQLDVNLGKLRLVRVFVVGEVASPGAYDVSSLSTVLNALAAAGGPTKNGTLRGIQVRREGKVVDAVDLYDFFLRGDKSKDVRLKAGDTVFVPVIGKVAGVAGNVRRPAIYELGETETLRELLALAGGIIPTGYLQKVQIFRVQAHERKAVADFNLDPLASGKPLDELTAQVPVQDMDTVAVLPIGQALRGYARIEGHVLRPGAYAWTAGLRVRDLFAGAAPGGYRDALLPEYQPEIAELTRLTPPDLHPEKRYFNLRKALDGDPQENLELHEFDTVRVFSRWEMEDMPRVQVTGEVQKPGELRLLSGMTVRDLVLQAGNLKNTANTKLAELVRIRRVGEAREAYRVSLNLERALAGDPQHNLALLPEDHLVVRAAPLVPEDTYTVTVSGQVRRPGSYRFYPNMTVRELLGEAGGPTPLKAYLQNAEINRLQVSGGTVTSVPITVNLEEALRDNPAHDIPLAPYDELIVRTVPAWMEETDRYVTVKGEVRFPGLYPIYKGERLSSVLERAGGFTDKAYLRAAKFTRKSVQEDQQRRLDEVLKRTEEDIAQKQGEAAAVATSPEELHATQAALTAMNRSLTRLKQAKAEGRIVIQLDDVERFKAGPYDVELQAGDQLDVPQSSNAVSVLGEVYNPTTLLTTPDRDVDYYVARAGGPTRQADQGEMYVLRADGSLFSRQQTTFDGSKPNWFAGRWFGDSFLAQKLNPGDTVVVPRQIEKIAWMREIKDITQIISQVALTAGVLIAAGL